MHYSHSVWDIIPTKLDLIGTEGPMRLDKCKDTSSEGKTQLESKLMSVGLMQCR